MAWGDARITAGSKELEVRYAGPAPENAPTIVLLHEGLGSAGLWRDFPERLTAATGFGVAAYSRAGYGRSDAAELPFQLDYMTREAVDVLPEVLDAISFRRGVLMGHSDGATIAAIYAGSVIDHRVRGTILMAPHFFTESMGLAEIAKAKEAFATTDLKSRMAKHHADPERTFRGWNDAWLADGFKAWNVGDVIDYFRIPTLAIQGRQDQYGTLAQIAEVETRSYAPVDVAILEECRHSPHQDKPDEVLAHVAEFCARLERLEAEVVALA